MHDPLWLRGSSPTFRLMIATSWLAPDSRRDSQELAIREAFNAGPDWTEYLRLVDRHRIPALSWAALRRVPQMDIPEFAVLELQRRSDACHMQAVCHAFLLAEVLKAFNGAGIQTMPIKGPLLSLHLYGDLGLRQSKDLDVMVIPQDVAKASACLEELGWQDEESFSLSPPQREAYMRHERHLSYFHRDRGCNLELHWTCRKWDTPQEISRQWARAISSAFQGYSHKTMNPIDLILYLSNHGGFHAWFRAKWLGDLACISAKGDVDWKAAMDEACEANRKRSLALAMRLLNEAYGLSSDTMVGEVNLPSSLTVTAVACLRDSRETEQIGALARFWITFRKIVRYDRLLWPSRSWRQTVADLCYCREDFNALRLPEPLFWAYTPLRPFLWVWRKLVWGKLAYRTGK